MNESVLIKCPVCGESNYKKVDDTDFKCCVCNSTFFVTPTQISQQLNNAIDARERYSFEVSDETYQNILAKTNDEKTRVLCYFGRLLSHFGVVYVKDFNGTQTITFAKYDPSYSSIKECVYYDQIMASKYNYLHVNALEKLDEEYKKIKNELSEKTEYAAFICSKISRKTKKDPKATGRTDDERYASSCHDLLESCGMNVFFSAKDLQGIEYDAQIYSALMRSKNLIVISTEKEYLESAWVQSEWRRWLNFIEMGIKPKDSIYLCIPQGNKIDLPVKLAKVQKFSDTAEIINRIKAKECVKFVNPIEQRIKKINNLILREKFDKAEKLLDDVFEDFPDDYRPWICLIDILIKKHIPSGDEKYVDYISQAKECCDNDEILADISLKYDKYLEKEVELEQVSEQESLESVTYVSPEPEQVMNDLPESSQQVDNSGLDDASSSLIDVEEAEEIEHEETLDDKYNKALEYYHSKQYDKAYEIYNYLQEYDYPNASLKLGLMYYQGVGLSEPNYVEAYKCFEKSANKGEKYVLHILGNMNYRGMGMNKPNYKEAFNWFQKSANEENLPYAWYMLGLLYDKGRGVDQNDDEAFACFMKAATLDYPDAQYSLAWIYRNGQGRNENIDEAVKWYEEAAKHNHSKAEFELGNLYRMGFGVKQDDEMAIKWYKKAAKHGNNNAKYNLSWIYGITKK